MDHQQPVLRCPVCARPLIRNDQTYTCRRKHSFDVSRNGYVNLLLANQKQPKIPNDSAAFSQRRHDFFSQGFLTPLAERLAALVGQRLAERPGHYTLADIGCGEGYYLQQLQAALPELAGASTWTAYGLDNSKHAVHVAAAHDAATQFVVGNLTEPPVLERALDVLISAFAPIDAAEFRRMVKPHGAVIVVSPGPQHLFALKRHIYAEPRPNAEPKHLAAFQAEFALAATEQVQYTLPGLSQQQLQDVLLLPPHWYVPPAAQPQVRALQRLDVEIDVLIHVFTPLRATADRAEQKPVRKQSGRTRR